MPCPSLISAQSAPHPQTLVVNGQAGKTTVVQVNGRSYVDVEALAQIANGTVAFKDNQITLTVPAIRIRRHRWAAIAARLLEGISLRRD